VQHVDNAKQLDTDTVKVNPLFTNHWCTATLTSPDQTQRSLTVLRDSGSLQSLISRDKLCFHDYVDTESRLIIEVTGDVVRVPLVEVDLQSKYGTFKYLFGLVDRLTDDTLDALIGNDLDPPMINEVPVSVGVVTRSQTAALKQNSSADLPVVTDSVSNSDDVPLIVIDHSADDLVDIVLSSSNELIKLQRDDSTLSHLFELANDKSLISDDLPVFILRKVFSCDLSVNKSYLFFQELSYLRLLYQSL